MSRRENRPDRALGAVFDEDVDAYHAGRPGYPERVWEIVSGECGVAAGSHVVEIGPGTGQATRRLLDLGARVTAVELGASMAERLRHELPHDELDIIVSSFDDADDAQLPAPGTIDAVLAATSFHWLDTHPALLRCARLLRPGGHLVLLWTVYVDPDRPDPFRDRSQEVLRWVSPEVLGQNTTGMAADGGVPYALDLDARRAEIAATGRFGPTRFEKIPWTGRHDADGIRRLYATYSPWRKLAPDVRARSLGALAQLVDDEFGGHVERPYATTIYWTHALD